MPAASLLYSVGSGRLGESILQVEPLDGVIAQHKLLDLPAGGHGKMPHKLDVARGFLMTDLVLAISTHVFLTQRLSGPG